MVNSPRWMPSRAFSFTTDDLAVDLGTANTVVYLRGVGIVCNEPSVVAIRKNGGGSPEVLAVGEQAKEMLGRTPEAITAIRPLKGGAIADFATAELMLRHFIKKGNNRSRRIWSSSRVMVCVPPGLTEVERHAVRESVEATGSHGQREVHLIKEPIAGAIGAGLEITGPQGHLIIDVGSGTTDVAVISVSGAVVSHSVPVAGDSMNDALIEYVRKKYNLLIGERTAERVKCTIGSAYAGSELQTTTIKGRELASGLPGMVDINNQEVLEALKRPLNEILSCVRVVLEKTPPELAADIFDEGLTLVGGGALLRNFAELLKQETNLPVKLAENALTAAAIGAGKLLEDRPLCREIILNSPSGASRQLD